MMCKTHNSAMSTQGQGHNWRSRVWAFNFVSFPYLVYPYKDFHNFLSNVLLSETMCRFHDLVCWLKVKVTTEGHEFEPLISCLSHISFTPIRIFIIFLSNVLLSETMCRFHDSVCWLKVKVTIEGHEFEPLILCRSHISFTPIRIFIIFFFFCQMFCQWDDVQIPWLSMLAQSQGHNWRSRVWTFDFLSAPYVLYT